jgi:hypothetical protein
VSFDLKMLGASVAAIAVVGTQVVFLGGWFTKASESHSWSSRARDDKKEPTLDTIVAQVRVHDEALDRLITIEEQRASIEAEKEARKNERAMIDRELCARGVNPVEEQAYYCKRNGYPTPRED